MATGIPSVPIKNALSSYIRFDHLSDNILLIMAQSNATAVANGSSAKESSRNRPHHVLFTVWGPEPVDMINAIKKQYPDWTVSFVSIDSTDNFVDVMSLSDLVPDGVSLFFLYFSSFDRTRGDSGLNEMKANDVCFEV